MAVNGQLHVLASLSGKRALNSRLCERFRGETHCLLLTGINPEFLYLLARALGHGTDSASSAPYY
jgi:hypothetical protein